MKILRMRKFIKFVAQTQNSWKIRSIALVDNNSNDEYYDNDEDKINIRKYSNK